MELSEIELYRLEKAVRQLCESRNQNTPAELGKVQYEMLPDGVSIFKVGFLLDSSHINYAYPVARLILDSDEGLWKLKITEGATENQSKIVWHDYPHMKPTPGFEPQIDELLHDFRNVFW